MPHRSKLPTFALLGALVFASWACGNDSDLGTRPPGVDQAELRLIHLSPDAPPLDARLDNVVVATSLAFGDTTPFVSVDAGTRTLAISAAGSQTTAAEVQLQLARDGDVTVAAFDTLDSLQSIVLQDDRTHPGAGNIRLRAVHTAVGVDTVDIWSIPDVGEAVLLWDDLAFGTAGNALVIPSGAYRLGIDTNNDGSIDLIFETPVLEAGTTANVFAISRAGDVSLVVQPDSGSTIRINTAPAHVRVVHLLPAGGPIDLNANDNPLGPAQNISFAQSSGFVDVPPGPVSLDVLAGGSQTVLLPGEAVTLESGKFYTVAVYGDLGNPREALIEEAFFGLPTGQARVRGMHAAAGVGNVDVYATAAGGTTVLIANNVSIGAMTAPIDVPAGAFTLALDVNADGIIDIRFPIADLAAGAFVNFFIINAGGDVALLEQQRDGTITRIEAL